MPCTQGVYPLTYLHVLHHLQLTGYCTQNTPTPATLFYSLWNVARPVLNQPRMSHGAPMSHAFAWCIVSDILFCGQGWTRARIICHIVCYIPTFGKLCSVLFHGTSVHPYRYRTARTARPHPRTCIGGGCHAHRVCIPSHTYIFYSICSLLHTKYTYSCNPVL